MQSEDFDKKLREAADQHHPSYNETAWSKMEQMLDTHLPTEKKDRRRFLFFLLFFLLLGGGAWFFTGKPWERSKTLPSTNNEVVNINKKHQTPSLQPPSLREENTLSTDLTPNGTSGTSGTTDKNISATGMDKTTKPFAVYPSGNLNSEDNVLVDVLAPGKKSGLREKNDGVSNLNDQQPTTPEPVLVDNGKANGTVSPVNSNETVKAGKDKTGKPATIDIAVDPITIPQKGSTDVNNSKNEIADSVQVSQKPAIAKPAKKRSPATNKSAFFFTLSAGPDISAIGFSNTGKLRPVYGLGLGYTFANRFTIRTGLYVANKIYTAEPVDYKPASPPPNQRYLVRIDADCKVFEIPLTFVYQFGSSKKHNWFGAAGLSSYLMKEEKYDYFYKYNNGQTYTYKHIYENENEHLFSVLSLSGGYTRKLNKILTLSAEPYLKIPLNGIGNGNVKLNSGGVLFTLGIHPFSKSKLK